MGSVGVLVGVICVVGGVGVVGVVGGVGVVGVVVGVGVVVVGLLVDDVGLVELDLLVVVVIVVVGGVCNLMTMSPRQHSKTIIKIM